MTADLTAEELREWLDYDPATGVFRWKIDRPKRKVGSVAGCVAPNGYVRIRLSGRLRLGHRLAWLHVYGSWPDGWIDHKNGVRHDNRIDNLRVADGFLNAANRKQQKSQSGIKGVSYEPKSNGWRAVIKVNGKTIYLGYFKDKDKAAEARRNATKLYFGDVRL